MSDGAGGWGNPPVVVVRPWFAADFIRTGFGGVCYFRSRVTVNGHSMWSVRPGPLPYSPLLERKT
jgi:hypothetical protein